MNYFSYELRTSTHFYFGIFLELILAVHSPFVMHKLRICSGLLTSSRWVEHLTAEAVPTTVQILSGGTCQLFYLSTFRSYWSLKASTITLSYVSVGE